MKTLSTIYSWVLIILISPIWFLSWWPNKKSWSDFKSGFIKHKCEFDYDNPSYLNTDYIKNAKYYRCKHLGCNIGSIKEKDGSWCK